MSIRLDALALCRSVVSAQLQLVFLRFAHMVSARQLLRILSSNLYSMAFFVLPLLAAAPLLAQASQAKPHVLFILADDYGWGNMGVHRRDAASTPEEQQGKVEVHTPNMDALIDEGILLERHYTYKICSPTRSSIQSGRLAVHVNPVNSAVTSRNYNDPVSGYAGIPRNMTGIAEKMRDGGYRTHIVGKWDAGMATPEHSPKGRGYETWYGYYQHANDYWHKSTVFLATGEIDACLNRMRDLSMHNETYSGPVRDAISLSAACQEDEESDPGYEEYLFKQRVLNIIQNHDTSKPENPLFLFYSFHLLHTPLQVPKAWLEKLDALVSAAGGKPIDSENRRLYAAMTLYMDAAIGEAVDALKQKKMYDNTLIIFTSDNGGPIYEPGAASNHPLLGGKYTDWEGGVRTNAWVSGGFVPENRRGAKYNGIINVADWYGTLTQLASVDMTDHKSDKANQFLKESPSQNVKGLPLLHPVESMPQWGNIVNDKPGRTGPMHLSSQAVLRWPFKLVTGKQVMSTWQGPLYPNCSTVHSLQNRNGPLPPQQDVKVFGEPMPVAESQAEIDRQTWTIDCGAGCLVMLGTHRVSLSSIGAEVSNRAHDLFNPDRGLDRIEACEVAIEQSRTFGPFVESKDFYSPAPPKTLLEQVEDAALTAVLRKANSPMGKTLAVSAIQTIAPRVFANSNFDQCRATTETEQTEQSFLSDIFTVREQQKKWEELKLQQQKKQEELEANARAAISELQNMVSTAEASAEGAHYTAAPFAGDHEMEVVEVLKLCKKVERTGKSAMAACQSCVDTLGSKKASIEEAENIRVETSAAISALQPRIQAATRLVTDALNKAKENRDRIAKRIATAKRTEKKTALFSKYDQANMRLLDLSSTVRPQCFQLQHEPVAASQRWCLARAIVTESTVPGQLRKRTMPPQRLPRGILPDGIDVPEGTDIMQFCRDLAESGAEFAEQFDRSNPKFHNGNPTAVPLGGARVPDSLAASMAQAESKNWRDMPDAPLSLEDDYGAPKWALSALAIAVVNKPVEIAMRLRCQYRDAEGDDKVAYESRLKGAENDRDGALDAATVTILGMSSDVISERCRKCVEDVVAKGKFEFVDKETYGEYIQVLKRANQEIFMDQKRLLQRIKDVKKAFKEQSNARAEIQEEPGNAQEGAEGGA
eukprot:s185_g3.t1